MNVVNITKDLVSISSVFPKEEELALFIEKWVEKDTDCKV